MDDAGDPARSAGGGPAPASELPPSRLAPPGRALSFDVDRVRNFSDCVFAVSITLVAVALRLPEGARSDAGLVDYLGREWHTYLAFVAGFAVIGAYWLSHHRTFDLIVRADTEVLWLNFALLFFVVLTPFSVEVLGRYLGFSYAYLFFNADVLAIGIANWLIWRHTTVGKRLVSETLDDGALRIYRLRAGVYPAVFVVSTALSLVSIPLVWVSWSLVLAGRPVVRLLAGPLPAHEHVEEAAETDEPAATRVGTERERRSMARLISFSDNVYAFSITLLVVHFRMPRETLTTSSELGEMLVGLLSPDLVAYVVGFFVTAMFWQVHCRYFQVIRRQDGRLRMLNLVHLMAVATLPFAVDLVSRFDAYQVPTMAFSFAGFLIASTLAGVFLYATGPAGLAGDHPDVARDRRLALVTPAAFVVAVPVAFASPTLATILWFVPAAAFPFIRRRVATAGSAPP